MAPAGSGVHSVEERVRTPTFVSTQRAMTLFRAAFFLGAVLAAGAFGAGAACAQADTSEAALVWQDEFEDEKS